MAPHVDDDDAETERQRRMQALQMADLGTARREYISTVDKPNKFHRVKIEDIEASRASNRAGSKEHRLAEANKSKLSAWADAYKVIGGDVDEENLDPMLNGQTHRAQLSAIVRESGGQLYAQSSKKAETPARGGTATRGAKAAGRGGGVAGTRGRGSSTNTMTRAAQQAKKDLAPLPKVRQDPSLDSNKRGNTASPRRADRGGRNRASTRPATLKTRRVVAPVPDVNFESMLADPANFMAAVSARATATPPKTPDRTMAEIDKITNEDKNRLSPPPSLPPVAKKEQFVKQEGPPADKIPEKTIGVEIRSGIVPRPPQADRLPRNPARAEKRGDNVLRQDQALKVPENPPEERERNEAALRQAQAGQVQVYQPEAKQPDEVIPPPPQSPAKQTGAVNRPLHVFTKSSGGFGNKSTFTEAKKSENVFTSTLPKPEQPPVLIDFNTAEDSFNTPRPTHSDYRSSAKRSPESSLIDDSPRGNKKLREDKDDESMAEVPLSEEAALRSAYSTLAQELDTLNSLLGDSTLVMTPAHPYLLARKTELEEKMGKLASIIAVLSGRTEKLTTAFAGLALGSTKDDASVAGSLQNEVPAEPMHVEQEPEGTYERPASQSAGRPFMGGMRTDVVERPQLSALPQMTSLSSRDISHDPTSPLSYTSPVRDPALFKSSHPPEPTRSDVVEEQALPAGGRPTYPLQCATSPDHVPTVQGPATAAAAPRSPVVDNRPDIIGDHNLPGWRGRARDATERKAAAESEMAARAARAARFAGDDSKAPSSAATLRRTDENARPGNFGSNMSSQGDVSIARGRLQEPLSPHRPPDHLLPTRWHTRNTSTASSQNAPNRNTEATASPMSPSALPKSSSGNLLSKPTTKTLDTPSFPMSATTAQYARLPAAAAQPQPKAQDAPSFSISAAIAQYSGQTTTAAQATSPSLSSRQQPKTKEIPSYPMSAATAQYARLTDQAIAQGTPKLLSPNPNITSRPPQQQMRETPFYPASAAAQQYLGTYNRANNTNIEPKPEDNASDEMEVDSPKATNPAPRHKRLGSIEDSKWAPRAMEAAAKEQSSAFAAAMEKRGVTVQESKQAAKEEAPKPKPKPVLGLSASKWAS